MIYKSSKIGWLWLLECAYWFWNLTGIPIRHCWGFALAEYEQEAQYRVEGCCQRTPKQACEDQLENWDAE